ncbi:MAG: cation:proton antiporter [Candidatus Methylumidiphilus sp.]
MHTQQSRKISLAYIALVVAPIIAVIAVLALGEDLTAPVGLPFTYKAIAPDQALLKLSVFLAQLAVILMVAHGLGALMRHVGQPRVVGEILAGLILGPSLLGLCWPEVYDLLFPTGSIRFHSGLSQIGLILFMFLTGLEIDFKRTRVRVWRMLVVSHAGIALPMLGGVTLALYLYHDYSTPQTSFMEFALFLGCAMSVTALPVLARILAERGLFHTLLGANVIACAATADATAWGMLAAIVAMERETGGAWSTLWHTLAGAAVFLAFMFFVVHRILTAQWQARQAATAAQFGHNDLVLVLLLIILSALAMEILQLHAIFGAFVAGLAMPRDIRLRAEVRARFEDLMSVLLLPLFFAITGLRANLGLLATPAEYGLAGLIILVAVLGKLGGSLVAARLVGVGWREASALGILMNARGTVELVLLTIGLQDGIITPALFTMMVFMALITTMMTTPLISCLGKPASFAGAEETADDTPT